MRQSTDSDSVDRFKIHWYLNLELSVILVLNRIKQLAQVTERRHSVNMLRYQGPIGDGLNRAAVQNFKLLYKF